MKKIVFMIVMTLFLVNIYGELYEISIPRDDKKSKYLVSFLDIIIAAPSEGTGLKYVVDSSPGEIALLYGNCVIKEMNRSITIFPEYSDLTGINKRIDRVIERSGGKAQAFDIGLSIEGRIIRAVRISKNEKTDEDLPEALFVGLHHAREWISSEVTMGILEFLVENMDSNPFVSDILQNSVIWVIPMLNPDGYLFSWEEARMWRYNRRVHPDDSIGVDLNRNYDSSWIKIDYVHGEGPFSEPETQAVKNLIMNDFETPFPAGVKSLDGLITYHSYGQIIMYPPGSTEEPAEKHEYYKELAEKMAYFTFSECKSVYIVMQNSSLYFTFGEMTEWFMKTHNGKPSFTFELRPHMDSNYFFMLPEDQIRDTVKENITPALYFVRHLITGETDLNMDMDQNGVNDVIENTFFDYKCDRSDLETPDEIDDSESSDQSFDIPDLDNLDTTDTDQTDLEKNDSVPENGKGCNLTAM